MKKHDLPAMPFYWGDWFKCPEVRALSPEARCLWFEMLGLMWESTERGYLTLNGKPMGKETISRCLGFACDLLDRLLHELSEYGVYSVRADGAIYNRRMVRDAEISKKRADAGKIGGVCSSKKRSKFQTNIVANTEDEDEDEDERSSKAVKKEGSGEKGHKPQFVKPTIEEVKAYCTERKNGISAQAFIDHYESNGWMIGKNKMKSWQAAVRTWEHNQHEKNPGQKIGQVIGDRGEVLIYGKRRTDF